jgi:hypothetical protein
MYVAYVDEANPPELDRKRVYGFATYPGDAKFLVVDTESWWWYGHIFDRFGSKAASCKRMLKLSSTSMLRNGEC